MGKSNRPSSSGVAKICSEKNRGEKLCRCLPPSLNFRYFLPLVRSPIYRLLAIEEGSIRADAGSPRFSFAHPSPRPRTFRRGGKEWGWIEGVGTRKNGGQVRTTYSVKGSTSRAHWAVMVTYSDFRAGCCTNFPSVLRLTEELTSRKFPGPAQPSPALSLVYLLQSANCEGRSAASLRRDGSSPVQSLPALRGARCITAGRALLFKPVTRRTEQDSQVPSGCLRLRQASQLCALVACQAAGLPGGTEERVNPTTQPNRTWTKNMRGILKSFNENDDDFGSGGAHEMRNSQSRIMADRCPV